MSMTHSNVIVLPVIRIERHKEDDMVRHEHRFVELPGDMLDQIECACGWKSKTYFDGREYAHAEWCRHVQASQPVDTAEQLKESDK